MFESFDCRRLDFREFVRDLFAVYKTRIWMEQAVPDSNFAPSETVAQALQTGKSKRELLTCMALLISHIFSDICIPTRIPTYHRQSIHNNCL